MFSTLHSLAKRSTLILLITAEGDNLRVNVMPKQVDVDKDAAMLHPLSLSGTPEELDAQFADAVAIYEPSTLSIVEQAKIAANANAAAASEDGDEKKKPAASAAPSAKPGRKKKETAASGSEATKADSASSDAEMKSGNWPFPTGGDASAAGGEGAGEGAGEAKPDVDPRQLSIDALDEAQTSNEPDDPSPAAAEAQPLDLF